MHRPTALAVLVLGAAVVTAAPAYAAPSTAMQTFPLVCDNGVAVVAQVDARGLPSRNAWIDGRGIAARAFARTESGTVRLADGSVVAYVQDSPAGVDEGRNGVWRTSNPVSLSGTTACRLPDEAFDITLTLTVDDTAYLGIDAAYAGTDAEVVGHGVTTVYLGTAQLAARS